MSQYYCALPVGLTCSRMLSDNICSGGILCKCEYKKSIPTLRTFSALGIEAKPPSKKLNCSKEKPKSTDCNKCGHKKVCKLKLKFNAIKERDYPLVCECSHYDPNWHLQKEEGIKNEKKSKTLPILRRHSRAERNW